MAEHPNVARVRDAYAAFGNVDLDGALKDLADGAVFHFRGDGPNSGDHKGRAAIEQALITAYTTAGGTQTLDVKSIFADEDHAVVVLRETATRAADGVKLDVNEVHLLAIDADGKITDLWDIPDDPKAHDDFFDGR